MAALSKQRLTIALGAPAFIFTVCALITLSTVFKKHPDQLSIGLLADMLLIAPLAYYFIIRKTTVSKLTVLRVFTLGLFIATVLLGSTKTPLLIFVKTWIAPLMELALIGWMVWKFKRAYQLSKTTQQTAPDFLIHCRTILQDAFGNETIGSVVASEVSVFYYLFAKPHRSADGSHYFTSYKSNNILLLLYTFLFMFLVEAAIMHLLFQLWNNTAAWVLTGLSVYSCLQLLAHIRAIKARPTIITDTTLILRNGLLGGDAIIPIDVIERVEFNTKDITESNIISMALIKSLENHNVVIYLKEPIIVTKAFGMKKPATVILVNMDEHQLFIETLTNNK
jgi:membrane protein implicated in regulation of membrane protease activity